MKTKPKDDNDLQIEGTLSDDPFDGAEPMKSKDEPARPKNGPSPEKEDKAPLDTEAAPLAGFFLHDALKRMKARKDKAEKPIPLPWDSVEKALHGGLWPGLHVLIGNTGSGKTQFALQIAVNAARKGTPVLYIGLELGKVDIIARLLALLASDVLGRNIQWSKLFLGTANDKDFEDVSSKVAVELDKLPLHLLLAPPMGWKHKDLYPLVEKMVVQHKRPPLVVLDFLQLVDGDEKELRERIGKAAYGGRAVAKDFDASVIMVSATARENYARLEGTPKKNGPKESKSPWKGKASQFVDIGKESGEIEYSADTVMVLCQEPWPEDGKPPKEGTHVHLAIAKQRVGTPEWIELRFNGGWFSKPNAASNGSLEA